MPVKFVIILKINNKTLETNFNKSSDLLSTLIKV